MICLAWMPSRPRLACIFEVALSEYAYHNHSIIYFLFRKKPRIDWNISWWWLFCTYFASENNRLSKHILNAFGRVFKLFSIFVWKSVDLDAVHRFWTITKIVDSWQLVFSLLCVKTRKKIEKIGTYFQITRCQSNFSGYWKPAHVKYLNCVLVICSYIVLVFACALHWRNINFFLREY